MLSFHDFAVKYKLEGTFIREATTVDYGMPATKPMGLARQRGTMLPRTLVSTAGKGVAKGLCPMFINDSSCYWPDEYSAMLSVRDRPHRVATACHGVTRVMQSPHGVA